MLHLELMLDAFVFPVMSTTVFRLVYVCTLHIREPYIFKFTWNNTIKHSNTSTVQMWMVANISDFATPYRVISSVSAVNLVTYSGFIT